jgi:hypothetical protein
VGYTPLPFADLIIPPTSEHHEIMHYIFVDEAYSHTGTHTRIALASWAVEQLVWGRQVERLSELYKAPVLKSIGSMFDELDARASVPTADLENTLFRSGEIDGTDDIPRMARTDNIWSQCAIYAVSGLIRDLVEAGQEIGTVDIYFDPKSLKREHFEAIGETLQKLVVPVVKGYAKVRGSSSLQKLAIRRIEPVKKPEAGATPDKFQVGTWVADKLCSNSEEAVRVNPKRITTYDMSDVVRRTAQQFDGISFSQRPSIAQTK